MLLKRGANPNVIEGVSGWYPLHIAAGRGDYQVVQLLVGYGANIDSVERTAQTALYLASTYCHVPVIRLLLDAGAKPDLPDYETACALRAATRAISHAKGAVDVAELLLNHGADPNRRDTRFGGNTVLHKVVCHANCGRMVEVLLSYGADVMAKDYRGRTPLHYAMHDAGAVGLLIDHGADVHATDNAGLTPLHFAAQYSSLEIGNILMSHGASCTTKCHAGIAPFTTAICERAHELIQSMINNQGIDIITATSSLHPIHAATSHSKMSRASHLSSML
ncbi:ankyrin [Phaeosphaeriaceae sp. SRC1lsM3a]|nr:ankyrin [Stagonospora sp. SRC1lsM3a]